MSPFQREAGLVARTAIRAALEIDNHILGRNDNFEHVKKLTEILDKYQLKDTDNAVTEPFFPYLTLWHALRKDSDKEVPTYADLALEMKLFRNEVASVPHAKNLEEMRDILTEFSDYFRKEQYAYSPRHHLAA